MEPEDAWHSGVFTDQHRGTATQSHRTHGFVAGLAGLPPGIAQKHHHFTVARILNLSEGVDNSSFRMFQSIYWHSNDLLVLQSIRRHARRISGDFISA
jgi:hypothetical protein